MTDRQAIVDALATVDGLAPSAAPPATIAAYAAWPGWRSTRFRNQVRDGARETLFYAYVALPAADNATSIDAGDPLVEAVGMALADAGLGVELVEPAWWPVGEGGGTLIPVLRFSLGDR